MTEAKTAAREASLKDSCRTMTDYSMQNTETWKTRARYTWHWYESIHEDEGGLRDARC